MAIDISNGIVIYGLRFRKVDASSLVIRTYINATFAADGDFCQNWD